MDPRCSWPRARLVLVMLVASTCLFLASAGRYGDAALPWRTAHRLSLGGDDHARRSNGRSSMSVPYHISRRQGPPVAMVGKVARGIGNYISRFKSGTHQLFVNAQKIGPLRKRLNKGEQLTFQEYNLLQRTSGDLAKFVGLTMFVITKPELAPIMMSFFPQVIPSTYLSPDDKIRRMKQSYFSRVKSAIEHVLYLQQDAMSLKKNNHAPNVSKLEGILKAYGKGVPASLKEVSTSLYSQRAPKDRKGVAHADLGAIPRPFLVGVCNSIGLFHRFVPAFGLRILLGDYLKKIHESDSVLLKSDLNKLSGDDLMEACSQRSLSLGDMGEPTMRKNLKSYLAVVSSPPLEATRPLPPAAGGDDGKGAKARGGSNDPGVLYFNENNLRFALLGLNMVAVVREAQENKALQALFGCK